MGNYSYTPQSAKKKIVEVTQAVHQKMRNITPARYKFIIQGEVFSIITYKLSTSENLNLKLLW